MLTQNNTIAEFFDFFDRGDAMVQVVPVTLSEADNDTRLGIFIHGDKAVASAIMAQLMTTVDHMNDLAEQADAELEAEASESSIIT